MSRLQLCLVINGRAEEAVRFYAATFPETAIGRIHAAGSDFPGGKAGDPLVVEFTLLGQPCFALNHGPPTPFSDAISFQVLTGDQAETDRYWDAIVGDGGQARDCGWCRDRFGLSWQITPRALMEGMADPDPAVAGRVMRAMMTMQKIDIAAIEAARTGDTP
ncbi:MULTISPECIES: VOC family protein [unclassified Sphingomonas]|uniref:VOC family protein n=1 Tax=unclassified Sphingomonas TaxID=196159 RepID=UPI0006FC6971|nr:MULTISPECIES: VOC family protein [unclassified Sphingomonas]KQM61689.1 3-demethylubiquinone-9 3-methyltransferase [Sphingomonas sp. Leaf16]KQN12962.1 3-demethylubiquinone-9 3-methyltransferase [Sphingomonas sp. Leaf29]KQN19849.1 3-demethylubiquinone-9 3-methyltransferase [Sphingomonas sp. Leaf32]